MKFLFLVVLLALIGCGSSFKDEAEELSYLSALNNPTPEQWKRREALVEKREQGVKAASDRMMRAYREDDGWKFWQSVQVEVAKGDEVSVIYCERTIREFPLTRAAVEAKARLDGIAKP